MEERLTSTDAIAMATTGDKEKPRIDLGLGAILARAEESLPKEVAIELSSGAIDANAVRGDLPQLSEYERLADAREWGAIVRRAEDELGGTRPVEAQIWWVRGHLGAFSMPVTLLAAPLESLCRAVDIKSLEPALAETLRETAILTLGRLEEVGQRDLFNSLRAAMLSLGIEPERQKDGRTRKGTSSFRSTDFALPSPEQTAEHLVVSTSVSKSKPNVLIVGSILLAVGIGFVLWDPLSLLGTKLDTVREEFVVDPSGREQSLGQLDRKDPGGRLGSLFYAIDDLSKDAPASPSASQSTQGNEGASSAPSSVPVEQLSKTIEPRAEVNTKGPLEGEEFREGVEPRRSSSTEVGRREELQGGPPRAVLPVPPKDQAFHGGSVYRVVVNTNVVSAPSFGGRVIGQLVAGDKVLVEGRLGRWMRLRSRQGRGGYVLAADIEQADGPGSR